MQAVAWLVGGYVRQQRVAPSTAVATHDVQPVADVHVVDLAASASQTECASSASASTGTSASTSAITSFAVAVTLLDLHTRLCIQTGRTFVVSQGREGVHSNKHLMPQPAPRHIA